MDRLLLCTGELRPSKSAKKLKLGLQSSGKALLSRNKFTIVLWLTIRLQGSRATGLIIENKTSNA